MNISRSGVNQTSFDVSRAELEHELKLVQAAVILLRIGRKKPSASLVQAILKAAFGTGMRKQSICAHLKALFDKAGTGREPSGNRSGTDFKHAGNRSGTTREHHARDVIKEYEYKNDDAREEANDLADEYQGKQNMKRLAEMASHAGIGRRV